MLSDEPRFGGAFSFSDFEIVMSNILVRPNYYIKILEIWKNLFVNKHWEFFILNKILAFACIIASLAASPSYACVMMGMSDGGGSCLKDCEDHATWVWLCRIGQSAPQPVPENK
ncbi:hypothetical protein FHW00_003585 [Ochrobactrum sp. P6BSIII]|uniref:hypothetical protein n=1 Tax=unclassified Ochrobactrum TaxID=239106 RepID=UPI00111767C4|nr:hypothetical protein [Ochrobactrum sp. P6BSIII]